MFGVIYRGRSPDRVHHCRACETARKKKCRDASLDRYNANDRRSRMLREYGMSMEQFAVVVAAQRGRCKICRSKPERLHVDHCHSTGKVRALLCGNCNRALGLLRECPATIMDAAKYVVEHMLKNKT